MALEEEKNITTAINEILGNGLAVWAGRKWKERESMRVIKNGFIAVLRIVAFLILIASIGAALLCILVVLLFTWKLFQHEIELKEYLTMLVGGVISVIICACIGEAGCFLSGWLSNCVGSNSQSGYKRILQCVVVFLTGLVFWILEKRGISAWALLWDEETVIWLRILAIVPFCLLWIPFLLEGGAAIGMVIFSFLLLIPAKIASFLFIDASFDWCYFGCYLGMGAIMLVGPMLGGGSDDGGGGYGSEYSSSGGGSTTGYRYSEFTKRANDLYGAAMDARITRVYGPDWEKYNPEERQPWEDVDGEIPPDDINDWE